MMKKWQALFPIILGLGVLLLCTGIFPGLSFAARTVGKPVVSPPSIPMGQPTQLTVTSQITDEPATPVIPQSVKLERLNASNKVIANLGVMRDDGTNGDAVAGDKVFTLRVNRFVA